jgi:phytoene dehydrogenase-like protein
MSKYDAIIVGSGINSLVCAGVLAKRGKKVLVLEREAVLGGCIRTEALTAPGYLHDTMSTAHPLFVTGPGYAELKDGLHANGLEYCNNGTPTGVLLPDGRFLIMGRDRAANIAGMNALTPGDGDAYAEGMGFVEQNAELIFSLLGNELWSSSVGKMMLGRVWKQGAHETLAFFGPALQSCRAWLETQFNDELVRALLAPWVLHTGLGPESPMTATGQRRKRAHGRCFPRPDRRCWRSFPNRRRRRRDPRRRQEGERRAYCRWQGVRSPADHLQRHAHPALRPTAQAG